jgi:ribosomal protein S19E (S16A)
MGKQRRQTVYTWEDVGGVTPEPFVPENKFNPEFSSPRPQSLVEMFPDVISPIKGFQEPQNISFKTPEDYTRDAIKERNLPFSQRADAKLKDFLLSTNLYNRTGGDAIREIGTPILSGLLRTQQAGETNDVGGSALGLAGATFGTLMSPFTAIKMGTEKVAGETAGKVAEVGTLAFTGGIPLVVGYFASQGATELATKVAEGLELDPKETETVQEVAGLTAFILGDKSARSFGKKINTELGKKVKTWLDESIPDKTSLGESVFRKGEGESVPQGTYKDLLKGQDQQRVINNPPEKRPYQEPTEVLPPIELAKETPSALIFNESQIRDRIKEIDNEVRKAEKEGNESLYNELQIEKKKWQDQLPQKQEEVVKTPEIIKPTEEPVSKREQQKTTLYDENKKVINQILDENKGLLTEREISSRLNTLIEQGKLKKKVTTDSIKKIKQEWKDAQPKPEKQVIKSTPNELGLKIPNELNDNTVFHYGKNAPVKLKDYVNEHPEVIEKIKDLDTFEQVSDVLRKDWNERSSNVLNKKTETKTPNAEFSITRSGEIDQLRVTLEGKNSSVSVGRLEEFGDAKNFDKAKAIKIAEDIWKDKERIDKAYEIAKERYPDDGISVGVDQKTGKDIIQVEKIKGRGKGEIKNLTIDELLQKPIDKNAPAKDLLEKTTKEGNFPDSVWDEIFGKPQTREQILKDLDKAKREGLNNVGSVLGAVNVDVLKGYAKLGALNFKEGAKSFEAWSKKMIEDVGEDIRPYLRELHTGLKENAKVDDKAIREYIDKTKSEFNLELNKIDGKIIDPNTHTEGAARHKAGRDKSVIEFNDNTQGDTWYHEFAHVVNNYLRKQNPNLLEEFKPDIDRLIDKGSLNKPINEKFAEAFTRIYTDPNAPRTRLANILESFQIPKSFELARRTNKELGFEKLPEREAGIREEKTTEFLEQKFDAPKETINEIENARNTDLYRELRDDGTQTFKEALSQSESINYITEKSLLDLDPKTLNGKVYNKAEQVKIDRIAVNKALQVGELRKTFGDKLSTDQAKILEKEILDLIKLQALSKNNLREAARVMESARKRNRMSPEEYQLVDEIAKEIDKANKNTDLTKRVKGIEEATDPTLKDKALYWWYNGILSNPLTDIANIGGNLSNLIWEVATKPISIIDGSFFTGLKEGWQNAKRVWEGQQSAISKYTDLSSKYAEMVKTKTKAGTRIKNSLLPIERLKIEDAFFRSIFEQMREKQQAKITAKETGLTAKEVIDKYNAILDGKEAGLTKEQLARFEKEVEAIEQYANKMVFQKELGQTGKLVQSALNTPLGLPVKMLAIPFLRIAVNLTKMSLESSPVGLLKPLLKRAEYKELTKLEKQDIYRRAIAGTVILGGIANLVSQGKIEITGEAPSDPRIRELWEKAGYKSNSIVINNEDGTKTLIAYPNVSPFNITLGAVGTLMTEAKYSKPKENVGDWIDSSTDKALNSVLAMVRVLGNQSFLQGTSQLLSVIEKGNADGIEKQIIRMSTPNIFSLFQGNADFGEGKTLYETEGILDQVKERLGITGDLRPKVDAYGEDRKSTYRRFPIPRKEEVDKIAEFMLRTNNVIGQPSNPKLQGKETLSPEQYQEYIKQYKQNMHKALNRTYDLLRRLEKQGEIGTMTIDRLMDALKQESRELAKQSVKENQ